MEQRKSHRLNDSRGFTITELLTAVAVGAILSTIAVPVASEILEYGRLGTATRQVAFEIARARMEAIGQNVSVRIRLSGSGQYVRERSSDGVNWVAAAPATSLPAGVYIMAGQTGAPTFNRQGIAAASTTLTLFGSGTERSKTITTNILGRVSTS